jgi:hypothetical protein
VGRWSVLVQQGRQRSQLKSWWRVGSGGRHGGRYSLLGAARSPDAVRSRQSGVRGHRRGRHCGGYHHCGRHRHIDPCCDRDCPDGRGHDDRGHDDCGCDDCGCDDCGCDDCGCDDCGCDDCRCDELDGNEQHGRLRRSDDFISDDEFTWHVIEFIVIGFADISA